MLTRLLFTISFVVVLAASGAGAVSAERVSGGRASDAATVQHPVVALAPLGLGQTPLEQPPLAASNAVRPAGLAAQTFTCDTPVRIMPLGNSITYGTYGNSVDTRPPELVTGYRQPLYLNLVAAGHFVDFVGGFQNGQNASPSFDPDHQGIKGIKADEVAGQVYGWLQATPAEVVLLHVGTNDIAFADPVMQVIADVTFLLDEIDRYEDDSGEHVTVVLARIINRTDNTNKQQATSSYNQSLANLAAQRVAAGDDIMVVNHEPALTYTIGEDMSDSLHPNDNGYAKMATVWKEQALKLILPVCSTPNTPTPIPSATATPTTVPGTCGGLLQEAEAGTLAGAFVVGNAGAASGGEYVHVPDGIGDRWNVNTNPDTASYCFTTTTAGTYRIRGWVYADHGTSDSFFVQVDGAPATGYVWDVLRNTTYAADYVSDRNGADPVQVVLGAGQHVVTVFLREDGTRLDRIQLELVSSSGATPTPTNTPAATNTPIPTATPSPTAISTNTPTVTATATPTVPAATPTTTPTTVPGMCGALLQEAEAGTLAGAFVVGSAGAASGGQYVHVPNGTGDRWNVASNPDTASYCMTTTTAGTYRIRGWVYADNGNNDSFFVQVDGTPATGYVWDVLRNTTYAADYVSDRNGADPVQVVLGAGQHTVTIFLREDGTRLDRIELELVSSGGATPTSTATHTPAAATNTPTVPAATLTPTATPSPTAIATNTSTPTATPTVPAATPTATPTPTATVPAATATATATPTATATAVPGTCGALLQEAEAGTLAGAFVVGNAGAASGGQYVHVPDGAGNRWNVTSNPDTASYCFTTTTAGTYRIRGWVYADDGDNDSFFVQVDGAPASGYLWYVLRNTSYAADYVGDRNGADPVEVVLGAGQHTVTIFVREDGTRLDRIELELVSSAARTLPSYIDAGAARATHVLAALVQ